MSHDSSSAQVGIGPTDAEIEAWAVRERHRREQWARGPTPEQTALWAIRERERRTFEQAQLSGLRGGSRARNSPLRWWLRDIQLACIGALRLAVNTSLSDAIHYLAEQGSITSDGHVSRASATRPPRAASPGPNCGSVVTRA